MLDFCFMSKHFQDSLAAQSIWAEWANACKIFQALLTNFEWRLAMEQCSQMPGLLGLTLQDASVTGPASVRGTSNGDMETSQLEQIEHLLKC